MSTQDDALHNPATDSTFSPAPADDSSSLLSPVAEETPADREVSTRWHNGLDFGLLILRVALGGTMGAHGLQHLFGAFNGPGVDGFAQALTKFGFTSHTTLLSWITGIAEVAGGALVIAGLFTPLGLAALLGVAANIVYAKANGGFFQGQGQGFEFELLLGLIALGLLFTGPGRISVDVHTPWRKKPVPYGLLGLLFAAAASVLVIVLFR